jgi:hypothetical protein
MKQEEHETQCEIFRWAETEIVRHPELKYMFSTLNGVRLNIGQAVKAKKAGNKKGVPDIWLPVKRGQYSGLVIELKSMTGTASDEQLEWIAFLQAQGYRACLCFGFMESVNTIKGYLNLTIKVLD